MWEHILNRYKIVPICFTWLLFINEDTRPRKLTWGHREAQSWEFKLSSEDKNHKLDNLPGIPRLLGAGGEPWVLCVHYPLRPHPPASLLSSAVTSRGEATVHVHACKERGGGRGYNTSQLDHIHSLNFAAAGGRECTPPQLSCYRSRIGEGCVFTRCGQNTGLFTFCRCLPTLSTPMNKLVVTCWTFKGGIILITACRIGWQSGRSNLLFPLRRSVSSLNPTVLGSALSSCSRAIKLLTGLHPITVHFVRLTEPHFYFCSPFTHCEPITIF